MNQDRKPRYVLRKLTIGLASVMFGALLFTSTQMVHADEVTNDATETASSVKDLNGVSSETETDEKPVVATNASTEQPTADLTESTAKLEDNADKSAKQQEKLVSKDDDAVGTSDVAVTKNVEVATDKSKEEQEKTVANSVVDQINWDAVQWEFTNNKDVEIRGWNVAKGGYDVLLPNTADFYMKGIIDKDHIAEINNDDLHDILLAVSKNNPDHDATLTISHNKSADIDDSKLHVGVSRTRYNETLDFALTTYYDNCENQLTKVDLTNLDVSNVVSMNYLFYFAKKLTDINLSGWDTGNCDFFGNMFAGTKALQTLNFTLEKTAKKATLEFMFYATGKENLDLSNWNISNVNSFAGMFGETDNLHTLNISNWQFSQHIYEYDLDQEVDQIRLFDTNELSLTSGVKTIIAKNVNLNGHSLKAFLYLDHPIVIISDLDPNDEVNQAALTNYGILTMRDYLVVVVKNEADRSYSWKKIFIERSLNGVEDQLTTIRNGLNEYLEELKSQHLVSDDGYKFHGIDGMTELATDINEIYKNYSDISLLHDSYDDFSQNFTEDATKETTYWTIIVRHEQIAIDHAVKAGDIVHDALGREVVMPESVSEDQLHNLKSRTINITYPSGKTETIVQSHDFRRTANLDAYDNTLSFGKWDNGSWKLLDRIDLPEIPGYTLSQKVDEVYLTPNTDNIVLNVSYLANDGTQTISYVDDQTGVEVGTQTIEGKTNQVVPVTAQIPENWVAVDEIPKEVKIAVQDEPIKIRLKHATELVTPDKPTLGLTQEDLTRTITRTINIIDPSGKSTTTTQSVTFTRTAIVDLVDASIEYGGWSENGRHLFEKIDVPTIAGYTPSQAKVDSLEVTPETKPAKISITIKYVKNEVPAITSEDSEQVTVEDDKTSSQAPSEFQIVDGILMHNAIGYDENARTTMIKFKEYTPIKYLPELVTIAGKKFYKLADKNLYVKANNVTGDKRVLTHNAYIYDSKGKRIGKFKKLIKGKKVTTYGKFFKLKDGKKYFRIGKNQYLKVVNFK